MGKRPLLCFMLVLSGLSVALSGDGPLLGVDPDNRHLPVGSKIALLVTGLTRSITAALTLPTIEEHIIEALGPEHVDVFVVTSPPGGGGGKADTDGRGGGSVDPEDQRKEREEIVEMYRLLLNEACLKAVLVTNPDFQKTPQTTFVQGPSPGPWSRGNESCATGSGEKRFSRFFQQPFDKPAHMVNTLWI